MYIADIILFIVNSLLPCHLLVAPTANSELTCEYKIQLVSEGIKLLQQIH